MPFCQIYQKEILIKNETAISNYQKEILIKNETHNF